jgi:hypothetical protein
MNAERQAAQGPPVRAPPGQDQVLSGSEPKIDPNRSGHKEKIMAKPKTRQSDFLTDWEEIIATLTANAAELPHLEAPRIKLQGFLDEARSLSQLQDFHAASKQAASQRLDVLFVNGKKLATFLRTGIKEHYGNRNPKLVEFGLQTFSRRKAGEEEAPPAEQEQPKPE